MITLYSVTTTETHIFTDYNSAKEYAKQYMILCSIADAYVGDSGCGEVRYFYDSDGSSVRWNPQYVGSSYYQEDIDILCDEMYLDTWRQPTFEDWIQHCIAKDIYLPRIEQHTIEVTKWNQ